MQKHGIAEAAFSDRTERESARNRGTKAGAWVGLKQTVELEDLFHHEILIACDGVLDPQNLGAIIRLAAFFRVGGILLPADRAVGLSATVMDVAVGGVETVALCVVVNLRHALEKLQKAGLWILGTSEHAKTSMYQVDRDRRWCVVLGSEQEGMRPLIEKTCDVLCQIPRPRYEADALLGAGVSSLNVAASAGIVLGHLCSR
jgi:23S rRNA (guanosine2251-2'-O)-methyltransferase